MVKVRLTVANESDEAQSVLDVLQEQFEVLKVSNPKPQRNGEYSMIYVDLEVKNRRDLK